MLEKHPRTTGDWQDIAMSDDGLVIVAVSNGASPTIATSVDGGQSWVKETSIAMQFEDVATPRGTTNGFGASFGQLP